MLFSLVYVQTAKKSSRSVFRTLHHIECVGGIKNLAFIKIATILKIYRKSEMNFLIDFKPIQILYKMF